MTHGLNRSTGPTPCLLNARRNGCTACVLDTAWFARNWEPKLYGIEADDDYRVTHWAEIEWPDQQ